MPFQDGYRRYKIRIPKGADDYGMMYEVLQRRFKKGAEQTAPARPPADRRGKRASRCCAEGPRGSWHSGCAGRRDSEGAETGEQNRVDPASEGSIRSWTGSSCRDRSNPVNFAAHSKGLHLLQQVRDEAHRFAITYHRKLRSQEMARSELDGIPGIGPKRKKALLDAMGDLERIREASIDELRGSRE